MLPVNLTLLLLLLLLLPGCARSLGAGADSERVQAAPGCREAAGGGTDLLERGGSIRS
jgi:hypothetical protein